MGVRIFLLYNLCAHTLKRYRRFVTCDLGLRSVQIETKEQTAARHPALSEK